MNGEIYERNMKLVSICIEPHDVSDKISYVYHKSPLLILPERDVIVGDEIVP